MRRFVVMLALAALATPAFAGDGQEDLFSVYAGKFEFFGQGTDKESMVLGGEYRFKDQFNGLRPVVGGFANSDAGAYGYAGAYWDLPLGTAPFVISPGFAVGAWHEGSSKDLGSVLEFRSTMEVDYEFDSGNRLGVALSHISNAGIGSKNPGVETFQAVFNKALY